MPQASEALRRRWGGESGVAEGKAVAFLIDHGWKMTANGLWVSPCISADKWISHDEWEALQFLADEWNHALIPH